MPSSAATSAGGGPAARSRRSPTGGSAAGRRARRPARARSSSSSSCARRLGLGRTSVGSPVAATGGRRARPWPGRSPTLRVRASSQGSETGRLSGSKEEQERQARTRASWTASSASAGSPRTRRARASSRRRYAASAPRSPSSVHRPAQPPGRHEAIGQGHGSMPIERARAGHPPRIGERLPIRSRRMPIRARARSWAVVVDLLERQAELEALEAAVSARPRGAGVHRLVLGEAGIGKSSLVRASCRRSRRAACSPGPARTCSPRARSGPLRDAATGAAARWPRPCARRPTRTRLFAAASDELAAPRAHRARRSRTRTGRTAPRSTCCATSAAASTTYRPCWCSPSATTSSPPTIRCARCSAAWRVRERAPAAPAPLTSAGRQPAGRADRVDATSCSGSPAATRSSSPRCSRSPERASRRRSSTRCWPGCTGLSPTPGRARPAGSRALRARVRPAAAPRRRPRPGRRGRAGRRARGARQRWSGSGTSWRAGPSSQSLPAIERIELNADVLERAARPRGRDPFRVLHHAGRGGDDEAVVVDHGLVAARQASRMRRPPPGRVCYEQVLAPRTAAGAGPSRAASVRPTPGR